MLFPCLYHEVYGMTGRRILTRWNTQESNGEQDSDICPFVNALQLMIWRQLKHCRATKTNALNSLRGRLRNWPRPARPTLIQPAKSMLLSAATPGRPTPATPFRIRSATLYHLVMSRFPMLLTSPKNGY